MAVELTFPLRTERLQLRSYRPEDVETSLRYYSDPEVARYLLDEPWTDELAERRIAERIPRTDLFSGVAMVVERDGDVIGDLALWATDSTGASAEIGWVFDPRVGGRGYATEAAGAVLNLAFVRYGVHRVSAQMDARNVASAHLAERLGMQREAHFRANWWTKGEWTDTLVYAMLSDDPRPNA